MKSTTTIAATAYLQHFARSGAATSIGSWPVARTLAEGDRGCGLERARRSLDTAAGLADASDLVGDILGLLRALHHLVRRHRDIIDATDGRDP